MAPSQAPLETLPALSLAVLAVRPVQIKYHKQETQRTLGNPLSPKEKQIGQTN